jgi:hypothetical protein
MLSSDEAGGKWPKKKPDGGRKEQEEAFENPRT